MAIEKQLYEAQLQQIFRMLLENKTNEQIASELKISVRSVQNYRRRLELRYGNFQMQKTNDTLVFEVQLYKNRMLTLYKALENVVTSTNASGSEKAKAAEVAADLILSVLKLEAEGIKAIQVIISNNNNNNTNKGQRCLNNLQSKNDESNIKKEYNPNRKF
jgi:Bacterial regulatory proteins, luxR family